MSDNFAPSARWAKEHCFKPNKNDAPKAINKKEGNSGLSPFPVNSPPANQIPVNQPPPAVAPPKRNSGTPFKVSGGGLASSVHPSSMPATAPAPTAPAPPAASFSFFPGQNPSGLAPPPSMGSAPFPPSSIANTPQQFSTLPPSPTVAPTHYLPQRPTAQIPNDSPTPYYIFDHENKRYTQEMDWRSDEYSTYVNTHDGMDWDHSNDYMTDDDGDVDMDMDTDMDTDVDMDMDTDMDVDMDMDMDMDIL